MGFQRRSERLNGVLLLDALGEDIPEGGSDISEGSLAVPLCLGIPGPGNTKERSRCLSEKARRGWGVVYGEDQRGRRRCYHELTGKWQRYFSGRSGL